MLRFMRHQFALDQLVSGTEKTLREHLETAERNGSPRPPELDAHPLPMHVSHIWNWWCRLHMFRGRNGPESQPIAWRDIAAFDALHRLGMDPFEVELLEMLETEYRKRVAGIEPADDDMDDSTD